MGGFYRSANYIFKGYYNLISNQIINIFVSNFIVFFVLFFANCVDLYGILTLDSKENISAIEIEGEKHPSFPEKLMGEIASKIASGINYTTLGKPISDIL